MPENRNKLCDVLPRPCLLIQKGGKKFSDGNSYRECPTRAAVQMVLFISPMLALQKRVHPGHVNLSH